MQFHLLASHLQMSEIALEMDYENVLRNVRMFFFWFEVHCNIGFRALMRGVILWICVSDIL